MKGSLDKAERCLALATAASSSVREDRVRRYELTLAVLRLSLARRRADLRAVAAQAHAILARGDLLDGLEHEIGEDLRALALLSLGVGQLWSRQIEAAATALESAITLARRIHRP